MIIKTNTGAILDIRDEKIAKQVLEHCTTWKEQKGPGRPAGQQSEKFNLSKE